MKGWGILPRDKGMKKKDHINILELKAAKFAQMTFIWKFLKIRQSI